MAFFFWMRRSSLLETCHRFRRTTLMVPDFATFLRNRFSRLSSDSLGINETWGSLLTSFSRQDLVLLFLAAFSRFKPQGSFGRFHDLHVDITFGLSEISLWGW